MQEFRADLHCHTTYSDGTKSPQELVELAFQNGLLGLAITDHDTINAYPSALPVAKKLKIEMISGVEFSSVQGNESVHILAYSFSFDHPIIKQFCLKHHQRRIDRNREILARLSKQGMPITEAEVNEVSLLGNSHGTIGRPHIALAMIKKGYVNNLQEAFQKYLGEGKSCYHSGNSFTAKETIEIIHQANGLAVIAHPHLIFQQKILHELLELKIDGIECYYAKYPLEINQRWLKIAKKKGLLITGGSDYHGEIKPNIPLGCSWINEENFRKLHDHYLSNIKKTTQS